MKRSEAIGKLREAVQSYDHRTADFVDRPHERNIIKAARDLLNAEDDAGDDLPWKVAALAAKLKEQQDETK